MQWLVVSLVTGIAGAAAAQVATASVGQRYGSLLAVIVSAPAVLVGATVTTMLVRLIRHGPAPTIAPPVPQWGPPPG